jgi:hypothetical protein
MILQVMTRQNMHDHWLSYDREQLVDRDADELHAFPEQHDPTEGHTAVSGAQCLPMNP